MNLLSDEYDIAPKIPLDKIAKDVVDDFRKNWPTLILCIFVMWTGLYLGSYGQCRAMDGYIIHEYGNTPYERWVIGHCIAIKQPDSYVWNQEGGISLESNYSLWDDVLNNQNLSR